MPELRIGISGWTYPPWRGTFFPADLVQRDELAYAARQVNSIEINGTFYSLQRPSSYAAWYKQTPPGFLFAVKCPRFITHLKRLKNIETPLANFFASGVLRLADKLGPLLWQLPPSFRYDAARLEAFFTQLPRDTTAAGKLARRHDEKIKQPWLEPGPHRPLRHALEVRHPTFNDPDFIALLRRHNIGLVVADTAGKWPYLEDVTSDLVYVRLHGEQELYVSGYTPAALQEWARKIRAWHRGGEPTRARRIAPKNAPDPKGRHVFVYFDNDVKVRAPYDAMSLAHQLKIGPKPGRPPSKKSIKEKPRAPNEWPGYARRPKAAAQKPET